MKSMTIFIILCVLVAIIDNKKIYIDKCALCKRVVSNILSTKESKCNEITFDRRTLNTCLSIARDFRMTNSTTDAVGHCEEMNLCVDKESVVASAEKVVNETMSYINKVNKKVKKIKKLYNKEVKKLNVDMTSMKRNQYMIAPLDCKEVNDLCALEETVIKNKIIELNFTKKKLEKTFQPQRKEKKNQKVDNMINQIDRMISQLEEIKHKITKLHNKQ